MNSVYIWWGIYAFVILVFMILLGRKVTVENVSKNSLKGILVDSRGRVSLSHFQLVLWTLIIFSLIFGVWTARAFGGIPDPFNFEIPPELLILTGISVSSTVLSSAIKSGKDDENKMQFQYYKDHIDPKFKQMFMKESGDFIDQVIDVFKFQNFLLTIFLAIAFVVSTVNTFYGIEVGLIQTAVNQGKELPSVKEVLLAIETLPGLGDQSTWLTLLGISHAGYITGKIPK